jgi:hypothetical protein
LFLQFFQAAEMNKHVENKTKIIMISPLLTTHNLKIRTTCSLTPQQQRAPVCFGFTPRTFQQSKSNQITFYSPSDIKKA